MKTQSHFVAGMPHLDVYTLKEDWALATSCELHWQLLADSLGLRPSAWIDADGERMYGAVVALTTRFRLDIPLLEDDAFTAETELISIRKPFALSRTQFIADGTVRAEARLLSSFVKRSQRGSNKKFSKVRDLWTAEDMNGEESDVWIDRHHDVKSLVDAGAVVMRHEVNRMEDFNAADFLYFKNYIRIAKAAEWRENRGKPTALNAERECYFYGNVEDGEIIETRVNRENDELQTSHYDPDGRRIFLSLARTEPVDIAER